jgi:prepilin-type N-terminal cleavage/methylation domain-containing protein
MGKSMNKRNKNYGFTIIEVMTVIVIIAILAAILVPNFNKYIVDSKKVDVKSIAREFVMAVETGEISDKVDFSDSDSIESIQKNGGEKLNVINKYINNLDELAKISNLTIGDAKKIVNDGRDFEVDSEGNFLRVIDN